jgi:hypothetical protein
VIGESDKPGYWFFRFDEDHRMFRVVSIGVALLVMAIGCRQAPAPSAPSYAKYDLHGGRYFIEIEDTQGGSSLDFNSSGKGNVVQEERYTLTWGKSHRLQIENGALTIDGADRGKLQPGDRVVIKPSGDILINGTER